MTAPRDRLVSVSPARSALHLLWTVPFALVISFPAVGLAAFMLCSIGCYSPAYIDYAALPVAAILCVIAAVIVLVAVQAVPWTRRAWIRLLVALPVGVVWGGGWLLFGLRAFDPISPLWAR